MKPGLEEDGEDVGSDEYGGGGDDTGDKKKRGRRRLVGKEVSTWMCPCIIMLLSFFI